MEFKLFTALINQRGHKSKGPGSNILIKGGKS